MSFTQKLIKNLYERLGLKRTASQSDIKNAYYKLSKEHHPDRNDGCEKSAKKFREISEAYEILGNERSRKLYDRSAPHDGQTSSSHQPPQPRPRPQQQDSKFEHEAYEFSKRDHSYEDMIRDFRRQMAKNRPRRPMSTENRTNSHEPRKYDFNAWYEAHYGSLNNEQNWDFRRASHNSRRVYEQSFRSNHENIRPPRPLRDDENVVDDDEEENIFRNRKKYQEMKRKIERTNEIVLMTTLGGILLFFVIMFDSLVESATLDTNRIPVNKTVKKDK